MLTLTLAWSLLVSSSIAKNMLGIMIERGTTSTTITIVRTTASNQLWRLNSARNRALPAGSSLRLQTGPDASATEHSQSTGRHIRAVTTNDRPVPHSSSPKPNAFLEPLLFPIFRLFLLFHLLSNLFVLFRFSIFALWPFSLMFW